MRGGSKKPRAWRMGVGTYLAQEAFCARDYLVSLQAHDVIDSGEIATKNNEIHEG
jgi:hypothetical protein